MRVGLFGGSFNPIHNGHINLIKSIIKKNLVDEMWIIPCKKHAFNKHLAKENDRVSMIKLAIKKLKRLRINETELKSRGKNYTLKTLRKLKERYSYEFFWVAGSDVLYEINKWYKCKQLLKEAKFIVFKRSGYAIKKIKGLDVKIMKRETRKISSTEIREKIKERKSFKRLVPHSVYNYIISRGLYK